MGLAGRRRRYKARVEGLGMYNLSRNIHCLGCCRIVNEKARVASFAHVVPMLLSKMAADELKQGVHKL